MKPFYTQPRSGFFCFGRHPGFARHTRLQLEVLEDRTVPTIVFANRGQPSDTFTPAEHALIDRAIQIWEQRITIPQTISISFVGGSTSGLVLTGGGDAVGRTIQFQPDHLIPTAYNMGFDTTISIVGTPPDGQPWYIDPSPEDNSEFTPLPNNPFELDPGQPATSNSVDMLSVFEHEIGHALGFNIQALSPFFSEQGNDLVFTGPDGFQAFFPDGSHLDPAIYGRDLMTPSGTSGRDFPSDTDVHVLLDTYSSYQAVGAAPVPVPVTGDWTGTGQTQVGVVNPNTNTWFLNTSSGLINFPFNTPGLIPVTGDWNGTGQTQVGAVDPVTNTWYLNTLGGLDTFRYGLPGWLPVSGDWTGTGETQVGAVDPETATWYLNIAGGSTSSFPFGLPGWIPVTGDWTGTGKTQVGMVDPTTNTWYLNTESGVASFPFGLPGWKPVTGDWTGTGKTQVGVVDTATNTWYLNTDQGVIHFPFGLPAPQPVSAHVAEAPLSNSATQSDSVVSAAILGSQSGQSEPGPAAVAEQRPSNPADPFASGLPLPFLPALPANRADAWSAEAVPESSGEVKEVAGESPLVESPATVALDVVFAAVDPGELRSGEEG